MQNRTADNLEGEGKRTQLTIEFPGYEAQGAYQPHILSPEVVAQTMLGVNCNSGSTPTGPIPTFNTISNQLSNPIPILNTILNEEYSISTNKPLFIEDAEDFEQEVYANLPLFFKPTNSIRVPSKVYHAISKYGSRPLLKLIHQDHATAVDLCMIFLSNLADTYYRMNSIGYNPNEQELNGWKNLNSTILREQFSDHPGTYRRIIDCLLKGTSKGPIIECDGVSHKGLKSLGYRLAEEYRCKGVIKHVFQSDYARLMHQRQVFHRLSDSIQNPICRNLIFMYPHLQLPTLEEVEQRGLRLIKLGYMTKKGKKLTRLGNKKKSAWKHPKERSFLEDSIDIYDYLTSSGLMIPTPGGSKSGGRIVDSFTLMPSWIREMIKIDGKPIVEVDYSALHPNNAMNLYNGHLKYLTHEEVAKELGLKVKEVKVEHLSFFNQRWDEMQSSKVFDFYIKREPEMMFYLKEEKLKGEHGHKTTSRKLFKLEVQIMTEVINRLNLEGIYVGYVYDALFCDDINKYRVQQVMNEVIIDHGVFTTAKID